MLLCYADPDTWRAITASCLQLIVESYDDGEVTLTDSVEAVGRIAIGCRPQYLLIGDRGSTSFRAWRGKSIT